MQVPLGGIAGGSAANSVVVLLQNPNVLIITIDKGIPLGVIYGAAAAQLPQLLPQEYSASVLLRSVVPTASTHEVADAPEEGISGVQVMHYCDLLAQSFSRASAKAFCAVVLSSCPTAVPAAVDMSLEKAPLGRVPLGCKQHSLGRFKDPGLCVQGGC